MNPETWNTIIASFPEPHLLQTWQWGQVKSQYGWEASYKVWGDEAHPDAAALILQREISINGFAARLRVIYVPKGPLLRDWADESLRGRVVADLQQLARQRGAIFIKIDPDIPLGRGVPGEEGAEEDPLGERIMQEWRAKGWRYSDEQIQFHNTFRVDLSASEEELLARMKQKTRYNIRYAGRKGVGVRKGDPADFEMLYGMYTKTSARGGFVIRGADYYQTLWRTFFDEGMLIPLIAEVEGEPVGGVMLFHFGKRAWYIQGMSREAHRKKMPPYLLQWEAMRIAKEIGCREYDLWGAPEVFDESDSMWGVYRFKRGLGGQVWRTIGAYDYPVKPLLYSLYTRILPRILVLMRSRGKKRIHEEHEGH
jgi:peptidoglycan pentaglycine glycine transferase (the first glycine)